MFQCCLLLSMLPQEIVGEKMDLQKIHDSVNLILSLQVSIINFMVTCFQLIDFFFHIAFIIRIRCFMHAICYKTLKLLYRVQTEVWLHGSQQELRNG